MATISASKAGNWSDPTVWTGGVLPSVNDLASTAFAITIDQDINVQGLRLTTTNGVFTASGNTTRNITLNSSTAFGTNGSFLNILSITNTGVTNINTHMPVLGTNQNNIRITCSNTTVNINLLSPALGSSNTNGNPFLIDCTNTIINFNGDISSSAGQFRTINYSSASSNTTLNFTGNIYASTTSGGQSITIAGTSNTLNFTGTFVGNNNPIINTTTGTGNININGIIQSGTAIPIITDTTVLTVTASGVITNINDIPAFACKYFRLKNSAETQWTYQTQVLNQNKTMYSNATGIGMPLASNVRNGITYGDASQYSGTMIVPTPSDVRVNVPTDNTVGTASLTAEDMWNKLTSEITTSGSIGKLLKDNLDATISSRATNAGVVTELNTSNLDVAVRLRNASTVNLTGEQIEAQ